MTEAKHTPGPWFRDKESGFDCDVRAANGRKIASVNVQCMPRTKQQFDGRKAENNANAYLIAAAPELLEASMKVLQWFEAEDDHSKADFYQRMQMCRDAEELIRSAIAKATGN